ncbi:MAG: N-acetylmuramoyl-L-alanine amidase [Acidobacteriota bacterium]
MRVCVDPGHGGTDPGAVGTDPFELLEKDVNLAVALMLEEELEAMGHGVIMTRRQDRSLGLTARAHFANRFATDLFVSVHANAGAPSAEGMEVFNFPGSIKGSAAAKLVLDEMVGDFPDHRNRGVKEANFTVLRRTIMPAILVELEFLTNPQQLVFLADVGNQRVLAAAIARGVDGFVP